MDVKEYISSGILESYALGLVSKQERQEVECMSHIYPEIKTELDKIMLDMEELAQMQKIDPPAALKQKIFSSIQSIKTHDNENKEARVIPLTAPSSDGSIFKLLAAACFVGVILLGFLYYNQRSTTNAIKDELAEVKHEKENLNKDLQLQMDALKQTQQFTEKELVMFRNPDFKTVFLKNAPDKPENSLAIVCWNTKSKEVLVAVENLPAPSPDQQYQLWAIVDGKPMDMGMISQDSTQKSFQLVKTVDQPQAFAITLEKAGGSPTPTMENMYVIGSI